MTQPHFGGMTRRDLLQTTGRAAAAASVLSTLAAPMVHAAEDSTVQIAVVGCGGRGTGAASDALNSNVVPSKLIAMADVIPEKLNRSYDTLKGEFPEGRIEVPDDHKFIGFDGYKQAMDALRPGDVVILSTPPAFRWVQFSYAIEKGLNVFMEKPVAVDGPSCRKMLALYEKAKEKNLKVGVGLMCRHCKARGELFDRIQNGEMGDLLLLRAYRVSGPTATEFAMPWNREGSELIYQIRNFHSFLWASGGSFSDFLIHNIDECCWMKNDWPVEAKGFGGRHYRDKHVDQNFDTYTVEYTFADGSKFMLEGRGVPGCHDEFASYAHGSKGMAIISASGHAPARCRQFSGQKISRREVVWEYKEEEPNPYRLEWNDLFTAIIQDQPYNEVERGTKASLVTAMGRLSCHTGNVVTYDDMLNHDHEFAPGIDSLTLKSEAPLRSNAEGKYPIPQPGILKTREYAEFT